MDAACAGEAKFALPPLRHHTIETRKPSQLQATAHAKRCIVTTGPMIALHAAHSYARKRAGRRSLTDTYICMKEQPDDVHLCRLPIRRKLTHAGTAARPERDHAARSAGSPFANNALPPASEPALTSSCEPKKVRSLDHARLRRRALISCEKGAVALASSEKRSPFACPLRSGHQAPIVGAQHICVSAWREDRPKASVEAQLACTRTTSS